MEKKALSSTYPFLLCVFAGHFFSPPPPHLLTALKHLWFNSRRLLSNSAQNIFINEQKVQKKDLKILYD